MLNRTAYSIWLFKENTMTITTSKFRFFAGLICLTLFSIVGGCKKDPEVISNINIRQSENLDTLGNTFNLNYQTSREYACYNYEIENSIKWNNDSIDITIGQIFKPNICLFAFGPAQCDQNLGKIKEGEFNIIYNLYGRKINGLIKITATDINFYLPNNDFLKVTNSSIKRIPGETIWGNLGGNLVSQNSPVVNAFIDSLVILGATNVNYPDGDYGYFTISNGKILPTEEYEKTFIFEYTKNIEPIKDLVSRYGTLYGDSLYTIVKTGQGRVFRSWVK